MFVLRHHVGKRAAAAECAERVSVADLVAWARETRVECITLTGGEPALQPELPHLVRALLAEPGPLGRGFRVEIETNGAADLCELTRLREECASLPGSLTFTVDWKLPASGMEDRCCARTSRSSTRATP